MFALMGSSSALVLPLVIYFVGTRLWWVGKREGYLTLRVGEGVGHETRRSLDVLAVNDLGDLCYATPAIVDGRIYLRTAGTPYCFGKPPPTGSASGN